MKIKRFSYSFMIISICLPSLLIFAQVKDKSEEKQGEAVSLPKEATDTFLKEISSKEKQREEKISQIRLSYFDGKISFEEAKQKLHPLIKEELNDYLLNIDNQIKTLEARLLFLKKGKQDPSYLIERRIKEILGEVSPQEVNLW